MPAQFECHVVTRRIATHLRGEAERGMEEIAEKLDGLMLTSPAACPQQFGDDRPDKDPPNQSTFLNRILYPEVQRRLKQESGKHQTGSNCAEHAGSAAEA